MIKLRAFRQRKNAVWITNGHRSNGSRINTWRVEQSNIETLVNIGNVLA